MAGLMAALVAALLTQASDRTPWLAAILGSRYSPAPVIAALVVALAAGNAIAALVGAWIAPLFTPETKALLLALALVSAGVSPLFPMKPPDRLAGWRIGAFATTLLGIAILALGDRTQFITAALAARDPLPALAAIGATIGALAVTIPAALAGEAAFTALPMRWIRRGAAMPLLIAGIAIGLGALRLV